MKKLPITEASDQQLRKFAIDVQQIDAVPHDRAGIVAKLIEAGYEQDYIFVDGEEEPADELVLSEQIETPSEIPADMPSNGFAFWTRPPQGAPKCPMVVCRILPTDRAGGAEPAAPIINNSPPLIIQRNKLVRIPYDFYVVLKGAGGTSVRAGARPEDDLVYTDYSEYPTTDVILPSAAEVNAWNAWAGQHELGKAKAA